MTKPKIGTANSWMKACISLKAGQQCGTRLVLANVLVSSIEQKEGAKTEIESSGVKHYLYHYNKLKMSLLVSASFLLHNPESNVP
jgi:hypothetical protein